MTRSSATSWTKCKGHRPAQDTEAPGPLSPIAILALDGLLSVAIGLAAIATGSSYGTALFTGWAGGAVATVVLLGGWVLAGEARQRRHAARARREADCVTAWDADRAADQADARAGAHPTPPGRDRPAA